MKSYPQVVKAIAPLRRPYRERKNGAIERRLSFSLSPIAPRMVAHYGAFGAIGN
jgi:hypothetical protein